MKKIIALLLVFFAVSSIMAQPGHKSSKSPAHRSHQHEQRCSMQFSAVHNEDFAVYVDGDRVVERAVRGVLRFDIVRGQHEIVVHTTRPADKVAAFVFEAQEPNTAFEVSYNGRNHRLEVSLRTPRGTEIVNGLAVVPQARPATPGVALPDVPSSGEMHAITERIRKESFEDDRVQMAKDQVAMRWFTAAQIIQLANTLTFENNRLEFLMFAYDFCVDHEHYNAAEDVLKFQSNRNSLREFLRSKY
ncbi:MAG: DUF4476 domain-containing protein [Bacteroidales bacterium]|nr:DUF4476 domain-containing protein [Bacteroidales bacterium]